MVFEEGACPWQSSKRPVFTSLDGASPCFCAGMTMLYVIDSSYATQQSKVIICLARCQSRMNTEAWPPQSKAAASRSLLGLSAQRRQKHSTWVKQTEGPASPGSLLQAA
ncbi:hypothetical protein Peur_068232 [Populus x canadensis]|uniref:Uncharacterized protein n=1 Tax=Populus deltoides TaxID=3696 RepID=A0A8T2WN04_POPDE|nr:hypothetical protein H0E87_029623 [Populus deltoides]